jgi:sugar phosphate isomerase/epimerase
MTHSPQLETESDLKAMSAYLDAIGAKCREAGIRFGYHSHDHEFNRVAGTTMLDYFISHTAPENVFFEMDVYWAVIGKAAPIEYFNKYPGRFEVLHIKDKYELGQSGMVNFEAIFNNAARAGMKAFVVELESASTPNILRGLRESALYLRNSSYVLPDYSNLPADPRPLRR